MGVTDSEWEFLTEEINALLANYRIPEALSCEQIVHKFVYKLQTSYKRALSKLPETDKLSDVLY